MATIYVSRQGATLRKTGERLKVTIRKETLADVPLIKVSQVVVFGKASITAATLAELLNKQIEVCYLTQKGRYIGRVQPEFSKNSLLRIAQYKASVTPKHALSLAKSCVVGKLSNMRALLLRTMRDRPIKGGEKAAKRIQSAITKARRARTLDQARGHEGDGSAAYFSVFNGLITNTSFSFDKRVRRPPTLSLIHI